MPGLTLAWGFFKNPRCNALMFSFWTNSWLIRSRNRMSSRQVWYWFGTGLLLECHFFKVNQNPAWIQTQHRRSLDVPFDLSTASFLVLSCRAFSILLSSDLKMILVRFHDTKDLLLKDGWPLASLWLFLFFCQKILVASRIRTQFIRVEGEDADHRHGPKQQVSYPVSRSSTLNGRCKTCEKFLPIRYCHPELQCNRLTSLISLLSFWSVLSLMTLLLPIVILNDSSQQVVQTKKLVGFNHNWSTFYFSWANFDQFWRKNRKIGGQCYEFSLKK